MFSIKDNWQILFLYRTRPALFYARVGLVLAAILLFLAICDVFALIKMHYDLSTAVKTNQTITAPKPEKKAEKQVLPMSVVASWHLFGEADVSNAQADAYDYETIEAPTTQLNLTLTGVLTSEDPETGSAIIMDEDNAHKAYRVGAVLPGPAELKKVLPDRVIIEYRGRLETLWLYEPVDGKTSRVRLNYKRSYSRSSIDAKQVDRRNDNIATEILSRYHSMITAGNPVSVARVIQLKPHMVDGKLEGVQIIPGVNEKEFMQLGLQTNDLVKAVNGIVIDNPERAIEVFNAIKDASELNVVIQRGQKDYEYVYRLNNK